MHAGERTAPPLRPVTPDDEAFLTGLYASTRADVQAWMCAKEERSGFLSMQYRMQEHSFRTRYPDAVCLVIQVEGKDAGRIYVSRTAREIRILDLSLLPEYRGRGIGSAIINDILEEAGEQCIPVRLMVDRFNRARSLYDRMGFHTIQDSGPHYLMEWTP